MKATEQYFPLVLFIMLQKIVLTFDSVDEILKCDHSNENSLRVMFSWSNFSLNNNMTFEIVLSSFEILSCKR